MLTPRADDQPRFVARGALPLQWLLPLLTSAVVASVLALGALGTGVAFVLNFRVIRFAGASTSASVTYLMPIVATVIGVVGLGEHISWYQPAGALIVLTGIAISQGVLRVPAPNRGRRRLVSDPYIRGGNASSRTEHHGLGSQPWWRTRERTAHDLSHWIPI